jgi:hypothetical protein
MTSHLNLITLALLSAVSSLVASASCAFDSKNLGSTDPAAIMSDVMSKKDYDSERMERGNGIVYVFCNPDNTVCKVGVANNISYRGRNREVAGSPTNANLQLDVDTVSVVRGLTRSEAEVVETRAHQILSDQHRQPDPNRGSKEVFTISRQDAEAAIDRAVDEVLELRKVQATDRREKGLPDRQQSVDLQVAFWVTEDVPLKHDRTRWPLVSSEGIPRIVPPRTIALPSTLGVLRESVDEFMELVHEIGPRRSSAIRSAIEVLR